MAVTDADVRAALRRVWPDAAAVDSAQIRALGGGSTQRSFLAVAGSHRYVLRLPLGAFPPLLDLAAEARAMRAAAEVGLAPPVVAVDVAAGLLLTEYWGGPRTRGAMQRRRVVAAVVRALRDLHRLDVDLPVYAVARIASGYLAELERSAARALGVEERDWADELLEAGRRFDAAFPPTAFCHNDLAASNILADAVAAGFVDFEYAGRGAPLLDLASLAGMNGFEEAQRRQLLQDYYGEQVKAPALRELDGAIRMLRLLAYFWARVAEARAPHERAPTELVTSIGATLRQG